MTFTIEEIVGNLDQTLLSGVIVAAALAAVVERSVLGQHPVFEIPQGYGLDHASSLVVYAALGVAAALVAVIFTASLLRLRARFAVSSLPVWARPAIGGIVTAGLGIAVMLLVHVGGITGSGYEGLAGALSGKLALQVLVVLGVGKLIATVFSYSSGGAGGIFAPSLFIGAMVGGAFGVLDVHLLGHEQASVGAFALVGMGAVFAGVVRAPITSVLIIIEMTGGYGLTLPLMISNMVAYGIARHLRPTPIYEALLEQDGIQLHPKKPSNETLDGLTIAPVELARAHVSFSRAQSASELLEGVAGASKQEVFPVVDADLRLVGVVTLEDITSLAGEPELGELVRVDDVMRPAISVRETALLHDVLELMRSHGVRELPVVDEHRVVLGLIDEVTVARWYLRARAGLRSDAPAAATESRTSVI